MESKIDAIDAIDARRGEFAIEVANLIGLGADKLFASMLSLMPPGELGQVADTLRMLSAVTRLSLECQSFA